MLPPFSALCGIPVVHMHLFVRLSVSVHQPFEYILCPRALCILFPVNASPHVAPKRLDTMPASELQSFIPRACLPRVLMHGSRFRLRCAPPPAYKSPSLSPLCAQTMMLSGCVPHGPSSVREARGCLPSVECAPSICVSKAEAARRSAAQGGDAEYKSHLRCVPQRPERDPQTSKSQ